MDTLTQNAAVEPPSVDLTEEKSPNRGYRFWLILLALCVSLFLSALELTAVSTALPTIVGDLHATDFAWVGAAYSLASTAFLPMTGYFAEMFGRRISMLGSLVLFALGSVLCGSAKSMTWLVAARTVQGMGGGAILSVTAIILSDLVSLKDRGMFNGIFGLTWAIASAIGPVVGGSLAQQGQWRWLFYLNIPICCLSFGLVAIFLHLPTPPGTLREKLNKMDWIGNFLIIASSCSTVIALTWAGVNYPWSSFHILVPLVLGLCGFVLFLAYEKYWAREPLVPCHLLSNRTSLSGYIQTFLVPIVQIAIVYYLPVYFQACRGNTPTTSGINSFGIAFSSAPFGTIAGVSVRKLLRYRPQILIGWVLVAIGVGIMSLLRSDTSLAETIGFEIIAGAGTGIIYTTTYFPVLAPLSISDNARALAFFAFMRSFAGVWGVSIGSTVLQNQLKKRLPADFTAAFPSGTSIAFAAIPSIADLPEPMRSEVREAFALSISVIWKVMGAIGALGFVVSLAMKGLPLNGKTDEKWTIPQVTEEPKDEKAV